MIIIYNYTCYRSFLCDYYNEQKVINASFSYQYFANKAGFKTKTFIPKVMKGEKALAKRSTILIAKAMELKKKETEYFETMVNFNNATNINEKEYYFHKLQSISKTHTSVLIRENEFAYFAQWYYSVIRELVTFINWENDYKLLAHAVNPKITPKQAENAVELLVRLGMIKKMPSGRYLQLNKAMHQDDQVTTLAIQKFQKQTIEIGLDSLEKAKKSTHDISTLTVGISQMGFSAIKNEIKQFKEKIQSIVQNDDTADRVYQINVQLFPMSKLPKKT